MVTDAPEVLEYHGAKYVVREDDTLQCALCDGVKKSGEGFGTPQAVALHWNRWCIQNPKQGLASANFSATLAKRAHPEDGVPVRSKRGRRRLDLDRAPDPMEEVPERPGGIFGGPAAYFIRPGATISEALIVSPNGAAMVHNGTDRANSKMYQDRLEKRGFEYIGPTLTPDGIRRLAEVMGEHRQDYVIFLQEEIETTRQLIHETETLEVRDQMRRRESQFERQLEIATKSFDAEKMISELNDILKAQKLAALSPAQRDAMSIFMDDKVSEKIQALVRRMGNKTATTEDGFSVEITNASADDDF